MVETFSGDIQCCVLSTGLNIVEDFLVQGCNYKYVHTVSVMYCICQQIKHVYTLMKVVFHQVCAMWWINGLNHI